MSETHFGFFPCLRLRPRRQHGAPLRAARRIEPRFILGFPETVSQQPPSCPPRPGDCPTRPPRSTPATPVCFFTPQRARGNRGGAWNIRPRRENSASPKRRQEVGRNERGFSLHKVLVEQPCLDAASCDGTRDVGMTFWNQKTNRSTRPDTNAHRPNPGIRFRGLPPADQELRIALMRSQPRGSNTGHASQKEVRNAREASASANRTKKPSRRALEARKTKRRVSRLNCC